MGSGRFPYENLIAAHNTVRQVIAIISDDVSLYLVNPTLICSAGTPRSAFTPPMATSTASGRTRTNCRLCTRREWRRKCDGMTLTGTVMQNEMNIDELPRRRHRQRDARSVGELSSPIHSLRRRCCVEWQRATPEAGISVWISAARLSDCCKELARHGQRLSPLLSAVPWQQPGLALSSWTASLQHPGCGIDDAGVVGQVRACLLGATC